MGLTVIAAVALAGCGSGKSGTSSPNSSNKAGDKSPFYVGSVIAKSGALAADAGAILIGQQQAVDMINSTGGIEGHPLKLEVMDGQSSPTVGITDIHTLISKYHLSALLIGSSSSTTSAAQPIAKQQQIPVISVSVLPKDDEPWEYEASSAGTAEQSVHTAIDYAVNVLHAKTLGMLTSQTVFGQEDAKVAEEYATTLGARVVPNISAPATATSLASQAGILKSAHPDVVLSYDAGSPETLLAQAMQAVGMHAAVIEESGTTPLSAMDLYKGGKSYFLNARAAVPSSVANATERKNAQACISGYEGTSGSSVSKIEWACSGWDQILALQAAIESAHGSGQGAAINAALSSGSGLTVHAAGVALQYSATSHVGAQEDPLTVFVTSSSGDGEALAPTVK